MATGTPPAWSFSLVDCKQLYLIRHGQGHHNTAARDRGRAAYKDPTLLDARLDHVGKEQANALGDHIRMHRIPIQLVVVSPLRRTLETATQAFGTSVPMVAVELVREAHGAHPCDKRSPVSEIRKDFPHVDFSFISTDEDTWHNDDRRETIREVAERGHAFLRFIRSRPERNIAVVSHGVFLETLVGGLVLGVVDPRVSAERFRNCEMRAIVVGGWTIPASSHAAAGAGSGSSASIVPRKKHSVASEQRAIKDEAAPPTRKDTPAAAAAAAGTDAARPVIAVPSTDGPSA
ncbi:hypothetical protein FNF27_00100 [Cafeteria roenbergensis]|uniref:Phosphoglycerate mutase-like protein n=1 Tax=Cafeteria roenbergensis TaxID=33653 RepID=A0A5A8EK01_CAFRO|nr:hypothetical protein FNF29_03447 [Cafeteria roenbergensis]KAA0178246.1 hypothetical protein FNF27_00100 [Cafeteria roenbergensis]|eukprot:KAA0152923.1 hypothetical protein FNF29_03447 [Cafeteria roenbergensis]